MNPASNLVLVGPMGAGKTSIGKRMATRFRMAFVDADREIEARTGTSVATIFSCVGEAGFRELERSTLAELLEGDGRVIATGGGAVLDAGSRRLMRARGFVVYLHVEVARQLARLARDRSRPLLAGDDREQVLRQLSETRRPLYEEVADLHFDTNALSAHQAAVRLGQLLERHWTQGPAGLPAGDEESIHA